VYNAQTFDPSAWTRLEFEGIPVYVRDCDPCWFVPNAAGDRLLQRMMTGVSPNGDMSAARFLARLPDGGQADYPGRAKLLGEPCLRELWLHVTDRCNMACKQCLFASSPEAGAQLPTETALRRIAEALDMGCRVFALTGGEPFLHPGFTEIVDTVLAAPETHVVVLTNGTLLEQRLDEIQRWGAERFHLQVSIDGLPRRHDAVRGEGAFDALARGLGVLKQSGFPFTVSMCVDADNVADMPGLVETAAELGASNVHFMWLFVRGRALPERFAPPDRIFEHLRQAGSVARRLGVGLDNLEAFKTQIFAPPGTIHDGATAGWESAALGPDGRLYPSAALIGVEDLATPLGGALADAWRESSVLNSLRGTTAREMDDPLRFLLGGGDPDHCHNHSGRFVGTDPYWSLYKSIALDLIAAAAGDVGEDTPRLRLKMGDILESCGAHGAVALVHSNCLLSTAAVDGRTAVKSYYSDAAVSTKEDILNPACYPPEMMEHIPEDLRFRGYGCGSPVLDAGLESGQTVVDLGCGRGVECFLAARVVGPEGRVIGIDMLDPMLDIARAGGVRVAENLGYDNLAFEKGYLEALPLEDDAADLVLSNCVLNLSSDKRRTFAEILRVLKRGGRVVVSDVVAETVPSAAILNDDVLRGECIAGAMTHRDLVGILDETGFRSFRILKRVPYRDVRGHRFYSMTYEAIKPSPSPLTRVIYRGPMASLQTPSGAILFAGIPADIPAGEARYLNGELAILDEQGVAVNMDWTNTCACALPDTAATPEGTVSPAASPAARRHTGDCMVCGKPLVYAREETPRACEYCGEVGPANAVCRSGHFVCDACHTAGALGVIERVCLSTAETDMVALMQVIRRHPGIPMHGPEHHGLVPGVILATCRNLGGNVTDEMIRAGIQRGARVMGGACAFTGSCGAASGVGVAFSMLLDANPLRPKERQQVMQAVNAVATAIADQPAARCCQRDVWLALVKTAQLSRDLLGLPLRADAPIRCGQFAMNEDCLTMACPLWPDGGKTDRESSKE